MSLAKCSGSAYSSLSDTPHFFDRNMQSAYAIKSTLMPTRKSQRAPAKSRASLIIHLDRSAKRIPCLILDASKEGFRVRGICALRRGQLVELIADENTPGTERCRVVWVGKPGSKHEGEIGLESA